MGTQLYQLVHVVQLCISLDRHAGHNRIISPRGLRPMVRGCRVGHWAVFNLLDNRCPIVGRGRCRAAVESEEPSAMVGAYMQQLKDGWWTLRR